MWQRRLAGGVLMPTRDGWLTAGLFFVALATLMLEVLDTRLLSVVTWYHLTFFAVSMAMLGMAAGAVIVFLGGETFGNARIGDVLPRVTFWFAVVLAVSHVGNLVIPFSAVTDWPAAQVAALTMSTVVLASPFVLSGISITLALTRTAGPMGRLYGADLVGAAGGCLAIIWILEYTDITSTAFVAAACAAAGAACFARWAGRRAWPPTVLAVGLLALAAANASADQPLGAIYPKSRNLWFLRSIVDYSAWNAHSNVLVQVPTEGHVFLWGGSDKTPEFPARVAWASIDGMAGTPITEWKGSPEELDWAQYDVVSLAYRLRNGRAGVIGVGGGRDILTALAFRNRSVTGIEINRVLLDAITNRYRKFAGIADAPGVRLVHDEARSYLTRAGEQFDVLQMSLIDTWAATGAGAFTLSENGLYTREGWRVFLSSLTPTGVFTVSRWFEPQAVSETTRLLALGVAALVDAGVGDPRAHLMLVTQGRVATLLVSRSPFTSEDGEIIRRVAADLGFTVQVAPWADAPEARLGLIAKARTHAEIEAIASADREFDFSAPTDARPYFFNMLKPAAVFRHGVFRDGGIVAGNLRATTTLLGLLALASVLVGAIIVWPLVQAGRPELPAPVFRSAIAYFAIIGLGFMLIQIPMLQRFSIYLGHPTYTFSIVLFLMILAAGLGSLASDRLGLDRGAPVRLPLAIGTLVLIETLLIQPAIDRTMGWHLGGRTLVVAGFIVPLAFALGMCFPIGMRLVGRHSDRITAWMWGVNGACGVIASIVAVMGSMWLGINSSLFAAAALYALLALPMSRLSKSFTIKG
jgi:hypothetical protein